MATKSRNTDLRISLGMSLDHDELEALQAARVRALARVKSVRQPSGNLVFSCEESGGGRNDIGHYVGFLPLSGLPFMVSRKLIALGKNKTHRCIVASSLVRFEVFRYRTNYVHTWITLHRVERRGEGAKQAMPVHQTLFRGKYGEIDKTGATVFPLENGVENVLIPSFLVAGYEAALAGTRCPGCQCATHFQMPPASCYPTVSSRHCTLRAPGRRMQRKAGGARPGGKARKKETAATAAD